MHILSLQIEDVKERNHIFQSEIKYEIVKVQYH